MANKNDLLWVKPSELVIEEGFNVRYDYGDLEELTKSIEENGIKVPLACCEKYEGYLIVDGHRRYHALQKITKNIKVPIILQGRSANDASRTADMVIYNGGKRLTLLEESDVYLRLKLEHGWSQADISRKVGKSEAHISNCMVLTTASIQIKNKIKEGKVSASFIIDELKSNNLSEIEEIIRGTKTRRVTNKDAGSRALSKKFLDSVRRELLKAEVDENMLDAVNLIIRYSERELSKKELIEGFTNATL